MSIQDRRGEYKDFKPDKMLPGEWAVITDGDPNTSDGKSTYVAFGAGDVRRMASVDDVTKETNKCNDHIDEIKKEMDSENKANKEEISSLEKYISDVEDEVDGIKTPTKLSDLEDDLKFQQGIKKNTDDIKSNSEAIKSNADDIVKNAQDIKTVSDKEENNTEEIGKLKETIATKEQESINRDVALAIKQTASGEFIHVTDSADFPIQKLEVYGKTEQVTTKGYQLFDASKLGTKSEGGATVTNNGDGSFTIIGGETLETNFSIKRHVITKEFLKVGKLYINAGENTTPYVQVDLYHADTYVKSVTTETSKSVSIDITQEDISNDSTCYVYIIGKAGMKISEGTILPMIYQKGDGTWEPFTGCKPSPSLDYPQEMDNKEVRKIELFGKNLLKIKDNYTIENIKNGSFQVEEDGMIRHKNNSGEIFKAILNKDIFSAGKYTVSIHDFTLYSGSGFLVGVKTDDGVLKWISEKETYTFNVDYPSKIIVMFTTVNQTTLCDCSCYVQIERGENATSYEPYKEQAVILSEPVVLNGVADVKDTIECVDGVYGVIRRNESVIIDDDNFYFGSIKEMENVFRVPVYIKEKCFSYMSLCNCLKRIVSYDEDVEHHYVDSSIWLFINKNRLGTIDITNIKKFLSENPIKVIYTTKTTIFEPFQDEVQQQFKALESYYNVTNIFNSGNANMSVEYVANPNIYLENQHNAMRDEFDSKLSDILALLPPQTQAEMIEKDVNSLLESEELS